MADKNTKDKILAIAEKQFAKNGFAGTSIRNVVKEANVNIAAIHYHFGSKEALFTELVGRRFETLNAERRKGLHEIKNTPDNDAVVGEIVRAFLVPMKKMGKSNKNRQQFSTMIGRAFSELPELKKTIHQKYFKRVCDEFVEALCKARPNYTKEEIHWRFHFLICTMIGSLMAGDRLTHISDGLCNSSDFDGMIDRLVKFVTNGMKLDT